MIVFRWRTSPERLRALSLRHAGKEFPCERCCNGLQLNSYADVVL